MSTTHKAVSLRCAPCAAAGVPGARAHLEVTFVFVENFGFTGGVYFTEDFYHMIS